MLCPQIEDMFFQLLKIAYSTIHAGIFLCAKITVVFVAYQTCNYLIFLLFWLFATHRPITTTAALKIIHFLSRPRIQCKYSLLNHDFYLMFQSIMFPIQRVKHARNLFFPDIKVQYLHLQYLTVSYWQLSNMNQLFV